MYDELLAEESYEYSDFDIWFLTNEEAINILFAETGADRELDFDFETEVQRLYENKHKYANFNNEY